MTNPVLRGGVGSPQSIRSSSSVQHHALGTQGYLDQRTFRYASSTESSTLGGGLLLKPRVEIADQNSVAWASGGAIGSNKVTVTLGTANAVTEGMYNDGWLICIDGTGSAQGLYRIKSHPAAAVSTGLELTIYDTFEVAIVTGAELSIITNEYKNVLVHTGDDSPVIGVSLFTVPIGSTTTQYFWIQTGGPASVQGDASAFVYGDKVIPADVTTDDGQVSIVTFAGTSTAAVTSLLNYVKRPTVGTVLSVGDTSDLDFVLVKLCIE